MSICKRFTWVIGFIIITSPAWSQVASSPFSQYGVGDTYSSSLANSQASAGLGVSLPQFWYVNNQNPALLVYNGFATFQAGLLGEQKVISNSTVSQKRRGGNMNSLVLAFPVKHNKTQNIWGASLGLMPYSSVNYNYQRESQIQGQGQGGNVILNHTGTGGLTQLYLSNGVRIYKDLSLGVKAAYIFGEIDHYSKFVGTTQLTEVISFMKGKKLDVGLSYTKDSIGDKNYRVSFGAVYGLGTRLKTDIKEKLSQADAIGDTLSAIVAQRGYGRTQLPTSITTGISFSRDGKWALGVEYSYFDWSNFQTPTFETDRITGLEATLGKSHKISFGGEFTPNSDAVEGILKKMTFRAGFVSELCPYTPDGRTVKDNGVTFGFSIPTGRSSIDLGFKVGKRGSYAETVVQENYFKVSLGLTFNDIWFIKRKFD